MNGVVQVRSVPEGEGGGLQLDKHSSEVLQPEPRGLIAGRIEAVFPSLSAQIVY